MHTEGHILKQYCFDRIFVETGTCFGRTVEFVLAHGAKSVKSVEGDEIRYRNCMEKFKDDPRVTLWHGHSKDCLKEMIEDLTTSAVFFLDAHPSGEESYGHHESQAGNREYNQHEILLAELKIIGTHPIKNHTILIDDQHAGIEWGENAQQIYKDVLLSINPTYQFKFMHKEGPGMQPTAGCLVAATTRPLAIS